MEGAYLIIRLPLGEPGTNRLFDIENAGKIGPTPLVLRRQSLAILPGKGLGSCVRYGTSTGK